MDASAAVEARIRERLERLKRLSDRIIGCQVVVQAPHAKARHGNHCTVGVELRLPTGPPIVAGKPPHDEHGNEDLFVAIRDSFDALERQLRDHVRKKRDDVKRGERSG